MKMMSFDIDGTLEVGDPPGLITMDMVRQAKHLGCLIGSCSDRPLSDQRRIWEMHHIIVDFTVLKHRLAEVKAQFQADIYYHFGVLLGACGLVGWPHGVYVTASFSRAVETPARPPSPHEWTDTRLSNNLADLG